MTGATRCKRLRLFVYAGLVLTLASTVFGCGGESTQNSADSAAPPYPSVPSDAGGTMAANRNFAFLMKNYRQAVINPAPWAGYWWPYNSNGISRAAAKYDAARGRSAGAASWEISNHGQGLEDVAEWWGHCNGWTAAAILMAEPRSSKSASGETFTVSDRKALLSEVFMEVTGDFIGTRVDDPRDTSSDAFNDVWPAQFFLALTAVMGSQHRSIAVDRYTGAQVWNHPLVAYEIEPVRPTDYLGPDPQFSNLYRVSMATTIYWVNDDVEPGILTPAFDPGTANMSEAFGGRTLRYELWLDAPPEFDASGNLTKAGNVVLTSTSHGVIGGLWKNAAMPLVESHPDYMWMPSGVAPSSGFKNPRIEDNWVLSNIR